MTKTITLGGSRRGITLGNLRLRISERFDVFKDPQSGVAILQNHIHRFALMSDGKYVYIELWGEWFLFEPFLQIDWLKRMIGVRAST